MPGRVTFLWFYPEKPGEHVVTCAEYCGIMHSYMAAKIVVMEPAAFDDWYRGQAQKLAGPAGDHKTATKTRG
jgi:cytochrome c oxidase subunit II